MLQRLSQTAFKHLKTSTPLRLSLFRTFSSSEDHHYPLNLSSPALTDQPRLSTKPSLSRNPYLQNSLWRRPNRSFSTFKFDDEESEEGENEEDLKKICSMIQKPLQKRNFQIGTQRIIRLVDGESGTFIGTMNVEQAVKFAKNNNKGDVVLHNSKVEPALCRLFDYRKMLYKTFMDQVVKKDFIKNEKLNKKKEKVKVVERLRTRIKKYDIGNKIEMLAKKRARLEQVDFQLECRGEDIEDARAIFANALQLSRNLLTPKERPQVRAKSEEEFDNETRGVSLDEVEFAKEENTRDDVENWDTSPDDYKRKRVLFRKDKYMVSQRFSVIQEKEDIQKESEEASKRIDVDFTERELEELVREYFNTFQRKRIAVDAEVEKSLTRQSFRKSKRKTDSEEQYLEKTDTKKNPKFEKELLKRSAQFKKIIGIDRINPQVDPKIMKKIVQKKSDGEGFIDRMNHRFQAEKGFKPTYEELGPFVKQKYAERAEELRKETINPFDWKF